jgi:quinol monooxygenase YgiN
MAVLVTAEVPGQTKQGYDGMLGVLEGLLKAAPGFVLHAAYESEGSWRVIEVWESQNAATEFFAKHIHPELTARNQTEADAV